MPHESGQSPNHASDGSTGENSGKPPRLPFEKWPGKWEHPETIRQSDDCDIVHVPPERFIAALKDLGIPEREATQFPLIVVHEVNGGHAVLVRGDLRIHPIIFPKRDVTIRNVNTLTVISIPGEGCTWVECGSGAMCIDDPPP